ncbi:DsbA family protein [Gryllotalpicola koreensis]|uniref:Thioredoxin domain-containing protein n=1 Tax=Gryllotalpicola koreensis TaxID=993086 RepID=A0ABP8AB15_9MICO
MTNPERQTKAQRQNAAREKARIMREEAKRKQRRNRFIVQGSIGVAIIAVIAIVVLVVVNVSKPTSNAGPKNMISDGFLLTSTTQYVATPAIPHNGKPTPTTQPDDGKAHITLYQDLQCPYCDQFEEANDEQLSQWLDAGTATLEIHPISFLDSSSSGNKYSTRAANALACVANYDPQDFFAVNKALYDDQPEEGTNGRTDAQIIATLKSGGASGTRISDCVKNQTFVGWVGKATNRAMHGTSVPNSSLTQVTGTPTIIVNGKQYPSSTANNLTDPTIFANFVKSTVSGWSPTAASASPTPTPAG